MREAPTEPRHLIIVQAYYLAAPFAVERAPTQALTGYRRRKDVEVAQLAEYPVRGLVFEAGESLTAMAYLVGAACRRLQVCCDNDSAFHVLPPVESGATDH